MHKLACELRVASADDAAAIARVHDEARRNAYRDYVSAAQLNAMTLDERTSFWRQRIVLAAQNDLRVLVAEAEGRVCGFIAIESQRAKNCAAIDRIYVEPSGARQGTGTALMKAALDHLRDYGFEKATLWTFEENVPAQNFYKYMGFLPDGAQRKWPGFPKELRFAVKIEPW